MHSLNLVRPLASAAILLCLAGCSLTTRTSPSSSREGSSGINGSVYGGQQPISGATIQLFAVGTSGDGSSAVPLLTKTVTTDALGSFEITGLYSCSAATSVYITAIGGDPGNGHSNSDIALMTALGPCSSLTENTFISINEQTTVAAVFALAPYMKSITAVGSAQNDSSALSSAFALSSQLVNPFTGATPGLNISSGMTVPTAEISTLANILSVCINSNGGTYGDSSPCGQFLALTSPPNLTPPTNTVSAMLNLANNPTLNTESLFSLAPPNPPFQPQLAVAPPDFRVRLIPPTSSMSLQFSSATINFTATAVGAASAIQDITILNTSAASVALNAIGIIGPNGTDFVQTDTCPSSLQPSGACDLQVAFAPGGTGVRVAYLAVTSNTNDSPQYVFVTGSGVIGSPNSDVISGATADYSFLDGTGATLTDKSGNGNNGTLGIGASAPTWTSTGLTFGVPQSVSLPAALNASRTFYFAVYIDTIPTAPAGSIISNPLAVLLSSTLDANGGFNIVYSNHWDYGSGIYSLQTLAKGSYPTYSDVRFSGFHVIAVTAGTGGNDLDHFYLDGAEVGSYEVQGSSATAMAAGNYFLGSTNAGSFVGSGLNGVFYRAIFKSTEDSSAVVAANSLAILREVQGRGIQTAPTSIPTLLPQLFAIGDSITYGAHTSNPATMAWPVKLSLTNQPAYVITNMGIPSETITATAGSEPNRPFVQQCRTSGGPSVAIGFAGTNDIQGLGEAANTTADDLAKINYTFQSLMNWVSTMKQGGCKVFVGTMISRSDATMPGGTTLDAAKDIFDSQILSQAVELGADGVIDFAADPGVGADGASLNTIYNSGDRVHPSEAGQVLLATAASNTLNYYFGSNSSSPTTVTTATHYIGSGEAYINANPTTNQTLTLPDCTGPSGATYTISNIQAAFTVGVVARGYWQLIDGLDVATIIPIPSNSSATFHDVANPKDVSGCHWEM